MRSSRGARRSASPDAAAAVPAAARAPDGRRARLRRALRALGLVAAGVLLVVVVAAWAASIRPGTYSSMAMGVPDLGGAAAVVGGHGHGGAEPSTEGAPTTAGTPITELVADPARPADVRVELVARAERVVLPGGEAVDGFTLNGSTPGPEIRARQGELVEVALRNESVAAGTTLHWHGVDVPAAMDGVAGVTQDAVPPGGSSTYRFVAEDAGSYWYHAHQVSHAQVAGGLFGALVVEPAEAAEPPHALDVVALLHTYPGTSRTLDGVSGEVRHVAAAGSLVRVRIANTDSSPTVAWASAPFRLIAIDGTDLHEPGQVEGLRVAVTAGGRADLELRVPPGGARVQAPGVSLVVGPAGASPPELAAPAEALDPLDYGEPAPLGLDAADPDRDFAYDIGRMPGFLDGRPGIWWTINGRMGGDVPAYVVAEGDVVRMRIANGSGEVHPMHLHGHHAVVLSRDGVPASGSPWWVDSLDVGHGETYEIAFVADNPGVWMDHCHTLPHAVEGLQTHLVYEGVTTPYLLGRDSGNEPE